MVAPLSYWHDLGIVRGGKQLTLQLLELLLPRGGWCVAHSISVDECTFLGHRVLAANPRQRMPATEGLRLCILRMQGCMERFNISVHRAKFGRFL